MKIRVSTFLIVCTLFHTAITLADEETSGFEHAISNAVGTIGNFGRRILGANEPSFLPYHGEVYQDVWNQIASDPYQDVLPRNEVSLSKMGFLLKDMVRDAKRTVGKQNAILPYFDKLVHANGICFSGTWNITEKTPYTGYFKTGAKGLIIGRASTATSDIDKGNYRALGLAGRIFPTEDPNDQRQLQSASFFTIDDLGGTKADHFTDNAFRNAPPVTPHLDAPSRLAIGGLIGAAFSKADSKPSIRQVYEIAELGEKNKNAIKTPKRMELVAAPGQTVDKDDFRDELSLKNRGGKLRFNIMVSDDTDYENLKQIGYIEFTKDAASKSCDHRFHVHHPKWEEKYE